MQVVSRARRPIRATVVSPARGRVPSLASTVIPEAASRSSCSRRTSSSGSGRSSGQLRGSPSAPTRSASSSRRRTWSSRTSTRHLAVLDRLHESLAPRPAGPRHHEVEPAVGGRRGGLRGEPVGHEQAGPAPLPLQDPVVDVVLLGGRHPVHVVVRRHHRPRVGVLDGDLERQQVELAERAVVDDAVHGVALGLGLVRDQVLEARADPRSCRPRTYAAASRPVSSGSSE